MENKGLMYVALVTCTQILNQQKVTLMPCGFFSDSEANKRTKEKLKSEMTDALAHEVLDAERNALFSPAPLAKKSESEWEAHCMKVLVACELIKARGSSQYKCLHIDQKQCTRKWFQRFVSAAHRRAA